VTTGEPAATALSGWKLAAVLLGAVFVTGLVQASGFTVSPIVGAAFLPAGFALMAVLARLGDTDPAARSLGLLMLTATLTALALGSLALVVLHVVEPGSLEEPSHEVAFTPGGEARLSFMMGLLALSAATTLMALFSTARAALRDIIPIDPTLSSHAIALASAIAATLIPLLPLFVLGKPPLPLPPDALPSGTPLMIVPSFEERSLEMMWFGIGALVAAGPGSRRTWQASRQRLGLVQPAPWQAGVAMLAGAALAAVRGALINATATSAGSASATDPWVPQTPDWPGALVFAIIFAAGTELTFRGYLQPRLGLILTNLVLTAPLAWTSSWTTLFVLFGGGLVLGLLRTVGGTVTATLGHVAFLLTAMYQKAG
jgi:hypothetical protein